jgi:hypothetical protein
MDHVTGITRVQVLVCMYACAYTSQMSGVHQTSGCAQIDMAGGDR